VNVFSGRARDQCGNSIRNSRSGGLSPEILAELWGAVSGSLRWGYEQTLVFRSVDSVDEMIADWSRLLYHLLECISNRVVNSIGRINQVVYEISLKQSEGH